MSEDSKICPILDRPCLQENCISYEEEINSYGYSVYDDVTMKEVTVTTGRFFKTTKVNKVKKYHIVFKVENITRCYRCGYMKTVLPFQSTETITRPTDCYETDEGTYYSVSYYYNYRMSLEQYEESKEE